MWYILIGIGIGIVIYLLIGGIFGALCISGYTPKGKEAQAILSMVFVSIFWLPLVVIAMLYKN